MSLAIVGTPLALTPFPTAAPFDEVGVLGSGSGRLISAILRERWRRVYGSLSKKFRTRASPTPLGWRDTSGTSGSSSMTTSMSSDMSACAFLRRQVNSGQGYTATAAGLMKQSVVPRNSCDIVQGERIPTETPHLRKPQPDENKKSTHVRTRREAFLTLRRRKCLPAFA